MATLVFQAHEQSSNEEDFSVLQQEVEELILKQLALLKTSSRNWTIFRVARQATRLVSLSRSFVDPSSTTNLSAYVPINVILLGVGWGWNRGLVGSFCYHALIDFDLGHSSPPLPYWGY